MAGGPGAASPDQFSRPRQGTGFDIVTQRGMENPAVAVLERDVSIGAGGIIYTELTRILNGDKDPKPLLIDYILGLGGRDVTIEDIREIGLNLYENKDSDSISDPIRWHHVRGL